MTVSVCIATFKRPDRLAALLNDLVLQQALPDEVLVADNDAQECARTVVAERLRRGSPFPIRYQVQPVRNISLTRNCTVEMSRGDWLAFIDDDERAPPEWLRRLLETQRCFRADGVLGPVVPQIPLDAPSWIRRGGFYDWERMQTGHPVPLQRLRFGNVLLRGALLRNSETPFDAGYGLTGGEDGDLLMRLVQQDARLVWCDEAVVAEPVEQGRLSLRWLMLRALRGGQDFARHHRAGRFGRPNLASRSALLARAVMQCGAALLFMLLCLPLGKHRAVHWLLKATANFGKITEFMGWHYREYGIVAS